MLLLSDKLFDVPVMSLQTGAELARCGEPIIDPRNLTIVAMYVSGPTLESDPAVLHISDVREVSDIGYIVDDSNVLMSTEGLIRLQEIIGFGFNLIGSTVKDEHGSKLGKVIDYAYDPSSFYVQQLHTNQSLLRSLSNVSNIISRQQIIAVTDKEIIVDVASIKDRIVENAQSAGNLVNPFRGNTQPEQTKRR